MRRLFVPGLLVGALLLSMTSTFAQTPPRGACVLSDRSWCFPPSTGPRGGECWCLVNGSWEEGRQN